MSLEIKIKNYKKLYKINHYKFQNNKSKQMIFGIKIEKLKINQMNN